MCIRAKMYIVASERARRENVPRHILFCVSSYILFYAYTDTKILNIYGISLANCIKFLYNKAIESLMAERSCGI